MKRLLVFAGAVGAAAALTASPAFAYPPWVLVIRDCVSNGKLDGTYRPADLATALHKLRGDGDEYSDCAMAIRLALNGGSGKKDGPPPNGIVTESGAVASSPDDIAQLQRVIAAADADQPVPTAVGSAPTAAEGSSVDVALGGVDRASAPPYRVDTTLLAEVFGAWLVVFAGAMALRHWRRTHPESAR
jgi:hypothetical protein